MTALPNAATWTTEQFLAWEEAQEERYEFIDGRIYAMVGGTAAHSVITLNIASALRSRLAGSTCKPFVGELKLQIQGRIFYPDVTVNCARLADADRMLNEPKVIFEVLSKSTRRKDRLLKSEYYRRLACVQQYVMVEQDEVVIESLTPDGQGGWRLQMVGGADGVLALPCLDIEIPVAEIYDDTDVLRAELARPPD